MENSRIELARIIREARLASGEKQDVFAQAIGVVSAHLSRLEHGQGLPSLALVDRIANHSRASRMEMRRLLRCIKGYEEEPPLHTSVCLDRSHHRDRHVPVVDSATEFDRWIEAVLAGGRPPRIERRFAVDPRMTSDPHALWFQIRDDKLAAPGIAVGDLLLVEPSCPVVSGAPCFVRLNGVFLIARWLDEDGETVGLDPVSSVHGCPRSLAKHDFEREGGSAFRIAGVHPCYRPFVAAGAAEPTSAAV